MICGVRRRGGVRYIHWIDQFQIITSGVRQLPDLEFSNCKGEEIGWTIFFENTIKGLLWILYNGTKNH